jgi:hypothetical protein
MLGARLVEFAAASMPFERQAGHSTTSGAHPYLYPYENRTDKPKLFNVYLSVSRGAREAAAAITMS